MVDDGTGATPWRPVALVALVALVAGEALLLLAVAAVGVGQTVTGRVGDPASGVITSLLPLGVAAFLAGCALALWRGRRWARAPVVTWQLLQLAVGVQLSTTGSWQAGVPLLVGSTLVVMLVVSRSVTAATATRSNPPVA